MSTRPPPPPAEPKDLIVEAKRLTDRLVEYETHLAGSPWKAEVQVHEGDFALLFKKKDRAWYFACSERKSFADEDGQPYWESVETLLRDASITNKSKAARLLPQLIDRMRAEYTERMQEIWAANQALDELDRSRKAGA